MMHFSGLSVSGTQTVGLLHSQVVCAAAAMVSLGVAGLLGEYQTGAPREADLAGPCRPAVWLGTTWLNLIDLAKICFCKSPGKTGPHSVPWFLFSVSRCVTGDTWSPERTLLETQVSYSLPAPLSWFFPPSKPVFVTVIHGVVNAWISFSPLLFQACSMLQGGNFICYPTNGINPSFLVVPLLMTSDRDSRSTIY